MMLNKHDSHNEFAWDFEVYQKQACKTILLITKRLMANIIHSDIEDKEVQMCITEVGEAEKGEEDMGGDLNRLEPTKMEYFIDMMAPWFLLKEGGFLPYM